MKRYSLYKSLFEVGYVYPACAVVWLAIDICLAIQKDFPLHHALAVVGLILSVAICSTTWRTVILKRAFNLADVSGVLLGIAYVIGGAFVNPPIRQCPCILSALVTAFLAARNR